MYLTKDLTGQRFGFLTVIRRIENYVTKQGKQLSQWECLCDCGNYTTAYTALLTTGHKKSCGCQKHGKEPIDLTNQRFGKLTVIERVGTRNGSPLWKCKCDCGNEIETITQRLRNGEAKSCGCYIRDWISQRNRKYNKYEIKDNYVIGYTENGEKFFVDIDDLEKIKPYYWKVSSSGYIIAWDKEIKTNIHLHRLIMNCNDENLVVDHIGGSKTINDNRKRNLRIVSQAQNQMNAKRYKNNTSGHTGVRFDKRSGKWLATINFNYKNYWLGLYENYNDAVKAREKAEDEYFGEYGYRNSQKQIQQYAD